MHCEKNIPDTKCQLGKCYKNATVSLSLNSNNEPLKSPIYCCNEHAAERIERRPLKKGSLQ